MPATGVILSAVVSSKVPSELIPIRLIRSGLATELATASEKLLAGSFRNLPISAHIVSGSIMKLFAINFSYQAELGFESITPAARTLPDRRNTSVSVNAI